MMTLLSKVRWLKRRIERDAREIRLGAADRAHLATRGDCPFMGCCSPCEPVGVETHPPPPSPNAPAKPRD